MRGPGWFQRKALSREQIAATESIRGWVRKALSLPDETAIAVNEIVCTDPSCPGTETVMLIMAPGQKTRAAKVDRELVDVTEADVQTSLARLTI
jgi:hypothetical protein